jgi:REP element-mobilizing transposase RayT
MDEYNSVSHRKWECKYHVVFIPKRMFRRNGIWFADKDMHQHKTLRHCRSYGITQ